MKLNFVPISKFESFSSHKLY